MSETEKEYRHDYYLTAAQCNAQNELSPQMLVQNVIEVATEHANILDIGFSKLSSDKNIWVLSRLTYELKRYPQMHERFGLTTWIENFNRHFSERAFEITGDSGETLGYVRTLWAIINMETRCPADLSNISYMAEYVNERECPIKRQSKIRIAGTPSEVTSYTFRVSDIDCNRHVNSGRYVELITDQCDLQTYDTHFISRFEIAYRHEAIYGEKVDVATALADDLAITEISDGTKKLCAARMFFSKRQQNK